MHSHSCQLLDSYRPNLEYSSDNDALHVQYRSSDAGSVKSATTNIPDDELLTISYGCTNGEATANDVRIDYPLHVAQERTT